MTPPIALALVPELLRRRGLEVSCKQVREALSSGAIPGRREGGRWLLRADELGAAERYFQRRVTRGAWKGGAAGRQRAWG